MRNIKKLRVLVILGSLATVFATSQAQTVVWQIGQVDGAVGVNPIGAPTDEFPADDVLYSNFAYNVDTATDPINSPEVPGVLGDKVWADVIPPTDTRRRVNITSSLDINFTTCDSSGLTLYYGRYGSESNVLYLDGVEVATIPGFGGEGAISYQDLQIPLGSVGAGQHTITLEYVDDGQQNGHYIDYLRLESDMCGCESLPLCAGQTIDVGDVYIAHDATNLYVTFVITKEGACLTETHVHAATSIGNGGIPVTSKQQNPIPGQFEYSDPHGCVEEYTYVIPLPAQSGPIYVAAHAAVRMLGSGNEGICASVVHASGQGLRKDGTAVLPERSDPAKALGAPSADGAIGTFYSLGFAGVLTLEFPTLVGGALTVHEVTWGGYPAETADVYVSRDAVNWTLIGTASNPGTSPNVRPTILPFEGCIQFVKLVDTTNPALHVPNADGFDVDAVCAAYTCDEETAWGDGCSGWTFNDKNWATYFTYTVQDCQ